MCVCADLANYLEKDGEEDLGGEVKRGAKSVEETIYHGTIWKTV